MNDLLKQAWRNIWRNKRRTLISMSAIAFGLALSVIFIAIAEGQYDQIIGDAVRMHGGHLTIEDVGFRASPTVDVTLDDADQIAAKIAAFPEVKRTKLLVLGQGIIQAGLGAAGVGIMGVDPAVERSTSPIAANIKDGKYLAPGDDDHIVIGKKLAEQLKLKVGKKVVLSANNTDGEVVQELMRVAGIFATGADEADAYLVQVPIDFARRVFGLAPDKASQIAVMLSDVRLRDDVMVRAGELLGDSAAVRPWEEVLPDLAAFVRIHSGSHSILIAIIIFFSLFTILNTVLMSVLERTREFAVMLALGTRASRIKTQVVVESALMGLVGVAIGLGLGAAVAYWLSVRGLDLGQLVEGGEVAVSGFAMSPIIYPLLTWTMLARQGGLVLVAVIVVSLAALRRIDGIDAANVLR